MEPEDEDTPIVVSDLVNDMKAMHFKMPGDRDITEEDLEGPNMWAAVKEMLYFLYCTYDSDDALEGMSRTCPVKNGKEDNTFRREIDAWMTQLKDGSFAFAYVNNPNNPECMECLLMLSLLLLRNKLQDCEQEFTWAGPGIPLPPLGSRQRATQKFRAEKSYFEKSMNECDTDGAEDMRATVAALKQQLSERLAAARERLASLDDILADIDGTAKKQQRSDGSESSGESTQASKETSQLESELSPDEQDG